MSTTVTHPIADAIMRGEHDAEINYIQNACTARLKRMFRKGAQVEVIEGRVMGATGTIIKVNTKRISVDLGPDGQWNIPPGMLRLVEGGQGGVQRGTLERVELSELDGLR